MRGVDAWHHDKGSGLRLVLVEVAEIRDERGGDVFSRAECPGHIVDQLVPPNGDSGGHAQRTVAKGRQAA